MRFTGHPIKKTRNIGGYPMEMVVVQLIGGAHVGQWQATYYKGAEDFIWSECYPTEQQAADALDAMVTEKAKQFPTLYGEIN